MSPSRTPPIARQRGIALVGKMILIAAAGAAAGVAGDEWRIRHVGIDTTPSTAAPASAAQPGPVAAPAESWRSDAQAERNAEVRRWLSSEPATF